MNAMCVFPESWALAFRRCAPDPSHKHMDFDEFRESAPPPSQERSEIHGFRGFAMAALKTHTNVSNSSAGVVFGEHLGANFEYS